MMNLVEKTAIVFVVISKYTGGQFFTQPLVVRTFSEQQPAEAFVASRVDSDRYEYRIEARQARQNQFMTTGKGD